MAILTILFNDFNFFSSGKPRGFESNIPIDYKIYISPAPTGR